MSTKIYSRIVGTGSYVPARKVPNEAFLQNEFFDSKGVAIDKTNPEIVEQFEKITGIRERRYVGDDLVTSDIAFFAAREALASSGIDKEHLDYIIVAHTSGDIEAGNKKTDIIPSLASRVKHRLKIVNPETIAYDITFGCPGWVQGMIQADCFIRAGAARRAMIIGADVLSRVSDPHDRDSMLYADGAGATIIEAVASDRPVGMLSHAARSDTIAHAYMLRMGPSYKPGAAENRLLLKMNGHKLYEYALKTVPRVVQKSLDAAGLSLGEVDTILIHQANAKMDRAILERLFALYQIKEVPAHIMPMIISYMGNSSVATIPTLLDFLCRDKLEHQRWKKGNNLVFTSVGAGMNINAFVYKVV